MFRIIVLPLSLLFIAAILQINGEDTNVAWQVIKGELKGGELKITEKVGEPQIFKIPQDCTELEIRAENGTEVNWETVERVPLPNLKIFRLYLTYNTNTNEKEFAWKNISLFGDEPREIAELGLDTYLYINGELVFNYDAPFKYVTINTIDPNQIIGVFSGQDIELTTITIKGDTMSKNIDFTPPEGVTSLTLYRVKVSKFAEFIKKLKSLNDLSVHEYLGTIDISDILKSMTITSLDITNSSLKLRDSESYKNENLISLTLTDCATDKSFKAWKIMPNLTTFRYSTKEDVNLKDILVYKQLADLTLTNSKLTFTKPTDIYGHPLKTLKLESCDFDLSKLSEFVSTTFPNLTHLSVDASSGGTKPTHDFLNDILAKIPEIRRLLLDPFDWNHVIGGEDSNSLTDIIHLQRGH